jgi:hypothetical protein
MEFDHRLSGGDRVGAIDLNFVVVLRAERQSRKPDQYSEANTRP